MHVAVCSFFCGIQGIFCECSGLNYQASSLFIDTHAAFCGGAHYHHVRKSVGVHTREEKDENRQNKQVLPILPSVWEMFPSFPQRPVCGTCQRKLSLCSSDTGLIVSPSLRWPHECKFVYALFGFVFIFPAHWKQGLFLFQIDFWKWTTFPFESSPSSSWTGRHFPRGQWKLAVRHCPYTLSTVRPTTINPEKAPPWQTLLTAAVTPDGHQASPWSVSLCSCPAALPQ